MATTSCLRPSTASADIFKAPLTVTANNDAKFVTQADPLNHAGVSYSGFAGAETEAILDTSGLLVTRSNAGTESAGSYADVLEASGLAADNYSFTYVPGDFTIVPAQELLVHLAPSTATYGDAPVFAVLDAQYILPDSTVVDVAANVTGSTVSVDDGAGGTVDFDIVVLGAAHSSSGALQVSSYQLDDGAVTGGSANFGNNLAVVGTLTVDPLAVAADIGGVDKTYDATTDMTALTLGLTGARAGDGVTLDGSGHYTGKNAGSGLSYAVSNLMLGGIDASNYRLSGGDTATGNDGVITPAPLTVTAVGSSKVYDGNTGSAVSPIATGLLGTDSVSGLAQSFDNRNVGSGKTLTVQAGYVVNDGNGGNNYTISALDSTDGAITPAALVLAAASVTRTYDASIGTDATPLVTGLQGTDTVSGLTQQFFDRHAGAGKSLQVNGGYLVNDGNSGNNYTVSVDNTATGTITPATLTLTASSNIKTYDATTAADTVPFASGLQGSDTVTGLTESYSDRHAGSEKTLLVDDGFVIVDGNNGNNYTVVKVSDMAGEILPRPVTVAAPDHVTKAFDGTTSVPPTFLPTVIDGIGEGVHSALLQYASAGVATGKTVNLSNVVMDDGNGGNNYLVTALASDTGVILPGPPLGAPAADPVVPASIPVSPVHSVQQMMPVGPLQTSIEVAVTANEDQTGGFIRLADVRQGLPEIAAITHVAGPDGADLPAGASFDSLDGKVVFDTSTVLPPYLMLTTLDHENRLRQVKLLLVPRAPDATSMPAGGLTRG